MISCHVNTNKRTASGGNFMKPVIHGSLLHQKSIKTYCQTKNHPNKQLEVQSINSAYQKNNFPLVNDENCSYNANAIQNRSLQSEIENKQSNSNQVINLKKKIKKCSNHQLNVKQSYFRQKVTFIRKNIFSQHQDHDHSGENTKTQTYLVYRDSQIFPGHKNQQLRNRIVPQRIDNDGDTDDEQIEKFVQKIRAEFMCNLQRVRKEKQENQSSQSHTSN